ncbi:Cysteine--tRNA ligase [Buchnera aphidicola (Eriosoma lanigerum)]|uniref:cysteine--tRNA ligase n=1 Tax=Buchnera aphidicola TaxID=9 RepID=UPI0034640008
MLKIFNTLTRNKEIFKSIKKKQVDLYVCGITVYDFCHIGHGRTFIFFDLIIRYFKECNYQVKYVRNITDIDDKIITRSIHNQENFIELSNRMINAMHSDFSMLNMLPATIEPRVTNCIDSIIHMIGTLINKKHAYISNNGDVLFSVSSYLEYGNLSNQFLKKLQSKNKILLTINNKKNKNDFVLWKRIDNSNYIWDSPWGSGRPGWHIECSAMTDKYLGNTFDIHGGGIDLLFPHHENEKAQSTCFNSNFLINYWIHVGMLIVSDNKMSKSLNNSITLNSMLKKFNGETIRYFFLSTHYRSPLYYDEKNVKIAERCIQKIYFSLLGTDDNYIPIKNFIIEDEINFHQAMKDDFNSPQALKILFNLVKKINYYKLVSINIDKVNFFAYKLKLLGRILGFVFNVNQYFLTGDKNKYNYNIMEIDLLIKLREQYRTNKEWEKADILRKKLNSHGINIKDTKYGTKWYKIK